jgi:U3 small nucleolar RNA-associated protein 18
MVGGMDKHLRFFRIDGDKNEKQISVKFNDYPIMSSYFLGTTGDVILGGRKPFFYTYDITSGSVNKVSGLMGKNIKSHELLAVSPEGEKIAFGGGAGYIHLCSGKTKTWMMDLKMNTSVRSLCFKDEVTLVSSGLDADVYIWDLRKTGKCLKRFAHNDGTCTSSLAISNADVTGKGALLAVGAESGVVSLYDDLFNNNSNNNNSSKILDPINSIMNLTTKIGEMTFHPSGQLLAISSEEKSDQLKLVHLPTCTVYSNWPTEKSPFKRVTSMDFSPGGAYFAIGNNKGTVLLYQLNHFSNA